MPSSGSRIGRMVAMLALAASPCLAQTGGEESGAVSTRPWTAGWVAHPEVPGDAFGVFHFRRSFDLADRPGRFPVHVSADNRYRLFVNGVEVSSGPARGDLMHWRYETVDLAPHLRAGRNVLAAVVWNWGPHRPLAQISHRTAFLVQGATRDAELVNTGPEWKVYHNTGYRPLPVRSAEAGGYYAAAPGEEVDGAKYPWGWTQPEYSDSAWKPVSGYAFREETVAEALPRGSHPYGEGGGWQLVPRTIPAMEEAPVRFAAVRRSEGVGAGDGFLRGTGDLVVPARTRAVVLLDQAHLVNAYPVVETSGGAGGTLTLTYAESLLDAEGQKGNRDVVEGKRIRGIRDVIRPGGGERRRFQTLWFRTYRYVQLEVETADEPLRIHDVHGVFTAYPFEERARFSSDVDWLRDMWEINWRVARLCAWETYMDTPYYEQLQYVGDTRIQALISLYMSGDDRLMRDAILHFDASRIPEGITASRYPSALPQYIPPFSLLWVAMVHDYWMHRDDPEFVRRLIPGVRGVLAWFERRLDGQGMLGAMPWWNFVDWADAYPRGTPPGAETGGSALITLQFVYALQRAAELEEALGQPAEAARYRALADSIRAAVRARTWDGSRGLFADSPEREVFSQQTNSMAVLTGTAEPARRRELMERTLADSTLVPASYYFRFYVDEALREAGLAHRYLDQLEPWREMLALGLTTTPEKPEPTRSDSHAWSAHPNYGLLATVLGVRPAEAGFSSVRVAPSLGSLTRAQGSVPHPLGDVEVALERRGDAGIRARVVLPAGLSGVFVWNGREIPLRPGAQSLEL